MFTRFGSQFSARIANVKLDRDGRNSEDCRNPLGTFANSKLTQTLVLAFGQSTSRSFNRNCSGHCPGHPSVV